MRAKQKNPIQLNMMVSGHVWTGKSDFIATLKETLEPVPDKFLVEVDQEPAPSQMIECVGVENGPKVQLTVIDTPGLEIPLGLQMIKSAKKDLESTSQAEMIAKAQRWVNKIVGYIEAQFAKTLEQESKVKRNPKSPDTTVHVLLYLLSPEVILANKGLTKMDEIALEALVERVNVIPCLAKTDLVSIREMKKIQEYLGPQFKNYKLYDFAEEEEIEEDYVSLRSILPFTIINSEELLVEKNNRKMGIMKGNHKILGREMKWGIVETQNPDHCHFEILKSIIFDTHLEDLRETTKDVYYEKWRTLNLTMARKMGSPIPPGVNALDPIEE